jgi:hypothetical protein
MPLLWSLAAQAGVATQQEVWMKPGIAWPYMVVCMAVSAGSAIAPAFATCDSSQPNRTPISRYQIRAGEVYDKKTDLTWQRCSVGQHWKEGVGCVGVIKQMTWEEAKAQAANGWRLPTRDELTTLIAPTCKKPSINEAAFPDMELDKLWYWTSSPNGSFLVWLVDFADGNSNSYDSTDAGSVRLVRDGQ